MSKYKAMIISGQLCPYCMEKTQLVDSSVIYGKSYGMMWLCKPCNAYVGCHKGTTDSLGRVANAELREWKRKAHFYFDKIAKTKLIHKIWPDNLEGINGRNKAYLWLANMMGIPIEFCHIGMMTDFQCKAVIEISKKALSEIGELNNPPAINFEDL